MRVASSGTAVRARVEEPRSLGGRSQANVHHVGSFGLPPAAADINKHSKLLESLSDDISITYQQVDGRMGVSARDFVNARLKKVLPDGTIIVVWPAGDTGRAGPVRLLVPHSGSAMSRFTTTLCGQVHNCVDHPYDGPNKPVRGKHHDTGYIIQPVRDSGV